jgi:hypothetical protein
MKMHRSFLLPLLAAMAIPSVGLAGKSNTKSSFAYLNALLGSDRTDVYMDGKAVFRNAREGRAMKPKKLASEGYSIQVNAAKVGFNYLDLTLNLVPGREYALIPMGDLTTTVPISAILIDRPSLIVPKFGSHVVFAVALPDAAPVDLLIDGQPIAVDIPAQGYAQAVPTAAGKHTVELQIDGVSIYGPKKINLKKGQTTTLIATGTVASGDKNPVQLEDIVSKNL